jgi:hypothetical protein
MTVLLGVPPIAWIVLAMIWFGAGDGTVVAAVVIAATPIVFGAAAEGIATRERGLDDMARVFGASALQRFGGLAAYASWLAWRRPVARLWAFAGWLWAFAAVAAALLLVAATALRAAPALGLDAALAHAGSALLWTASFLVWLGGYLPDLADSARRARDKCG